MGDVNKSLQKSGQLLSDIIDFLPDATFVIDLDGKVIIWNRAIEEKTGVAKEDILGEGNYAHSIPAYGERRPSLIDLVIEDSPDFNSEYDFIRKEGQTLFAEVFAPFVNEGNGAYLRIKASPLLDNRGKRYGAIESIQDITDYKNALKSIKRNEKRLKAVMESVTDVIITSDLNGNILFSNDSIKTIFGYDADEIIGKNMTLLIPERYKELHLKGLETFQISNNLWRSVGRVKMIGTRKDGTEFPFEISLALWKSGRKEYATAIIRDITEQEKTDEVLQIEHEIAVALSESSDLIEILDICLDGAIKISKMDSGGLYLVDDNSGDLDLTVHSGISTDFAESASHYRADSPIARAIMEGRPRFTHFRDVVKKFPESHRKENLQAVAILPIQYGGKVIGCLNIASHIHDKIPEINQRALETINGLISGAIIRSKAEKALFGSEKKYRELVDYSLVAIYETTLNGEILFANNAMINMFEYDDIEDLKAINIIELYKYPVKRNEFVKILRENKYLAQYEIKGISKNGKIIDTIVNAKLNDNIVSGMIIDITELKKAEKRLKKSLNEKNLLIKEIHHRVKNNLQIISSLFDLQKSFVEEDPIALSVLKGSQNRVVSMAMIHEMLYQSQDLNRINISDYIENLITNLFYSYAENNVRPVINVKDFYLNIETSIPLGLILSELVSNSLKYAFPKEKKGEITVSLQCYNPYFEMVISDNGMGLPEDIDFRNVESSLGLRLVNSLVNQLDGTIKLDKSHGTKYTIKFKELKYEKRI